MRFIILGDSKGKDYGINEDVLRKIMYQTSKLDPQPEFIVLCGDNVAGSPDEKILATQLQGLRKLIKKYHPNITLIPVVGNHEAGGEPVDDSYEKLLNEVYSDFIPDGLLSSYNATAYYKDFGNTRLIVLNAFHYGLVHRISEEQLTWLKEITAIDMKYKMVFVHSPAFPTGAHLGHCLDSYPSFRDAFWKIIDEGHVNIVFSGHEHNYSRREISPSTGYASCGYNRSIYQIITGGGGEKLRDKYRSKEGVVVPPINTYHFIVADIFAEGISISAISSKGKKLDVFKVK